MKKVIGISAVILELIFAGCGNRNGREDDSTMSDSMLNSNIDSSYQNSNASPTNPSNMSSDTMRRDSMMRVDTPVHK
jgi:hypothetical protein